MKRTLAILLVLVICTCIAACGNTISEPETGTSGRTADTEQTENAPEHAQEAAPEMPATESVPEPEEDLTEGPETAPVSEPVPEPVTEISDTEVTTDDKGNIYLTESQVAANVQIIELTLDNWQDYFENRFWENDVVNAFGEVEETKHYCGTYLKSQYVGTGANVAFKVTRFGSLSHALYPDGRDCDPAIWMTDTIEARFYIYDMEGNLIDDTTPAMVSKDYEIFEPAADIMGQYGCRFRIFAEGPCTEIIGTLAIIEIPEILQEELLRLWHDNPDGLRFCVMKDNGVLTDLSSYLSMNFL